MCKDQLRKLSCAARKGRTAPGWPNDRTAKGMTMEFLDGRAAAESLVSYVHDRLAESDFFSALSAGEMPPGHVREVFGQYFLWRDRFHLWLDACVAKVTPSDDGPGAPRVPGELIERLAQEVKAPPRELAPSFLAILGVDHPSRIAVLPVTDAYAESFLRCYCPAARSGDEALAALAGRELSVPGRNEIIVSALPRHYGVTSGLDFFRPRASFDMEHFRELWLAFARDDKADFWQLIEAARLEIWEHITFWDDVYSAVLAAGRPLTADWVIAQNN